MVEWRAAKLKRTIPALDMAVKSTSGTESGSGMGAKAGTPDLPGLAEQHGPRRAAASGVGAVEGGTAGRGWIRTGRRWGTELAAALLPDLARQSPDPGKRTKDLAVEPHNGDEQHRGCGGA